MTQRKRFLNLRFDGADLKTSVSDDTGTLAMVATSQPESTAPALATRCVSTVGLTDEQLRATPVSVVTDGLTNAQLRASPVSITGGLTDAQLRAAPIPVVASVSIDAVSLGNMAGGKQLVLRSGSLDTVSILIDQQIHAYTVPAGKTFYLQHLNLSARRNASLGTATIFGPLSLMLSGVKSQTWDMFGSGGVSVVCNFAEPLPIAANTLMQFVCTPTATTQFTWQVNVVGFIK